jgi:glucose/arabinose dehydrogenase
MRTLLGIALALALVPIAQAQQVNVRQLATGLPNITSIVHAQDSRLFLTLQRGQVRIWDGTAILPAPFLDISSRVSCCGEQGLLSIVFHPRYRENGFFFVNYTDREGKTVVARYSVTSDRNVADPNSETVLLTVPQPFDNHNGGEMQFGPDGYLYIGLGDGGSGGDPLNNGQNLNSLLGKILRIDVDDHPPYAIPPSNPFAKSTTARPEIWAYGLRNPWRFTFDRENGDLWIADVGQGSWEEVNLQRSTSIGGENYGWRKMEGRHCFNPTSNCADATMTMPIVEYSHSFGCSITGGYRYRGARYPALRGLYFFTDFCSGDLWAARESATGNWTASVVLDTALDPTTFGEDENGELYLGTQDNGFYALIDETPRPPRRRIAGK